MSRLPRSVAALLLLGAAHAWVACPAPRAKTQPEEVVRAYAAAVKAGKVSEAYDMMSETFRQRHSRAAFSRMMKQNPAEIRGKLATLAKGSRRVTMKAHLNYGDGDGDELALVVEGGQWRLASTPINFYGQGSAREALRSFVRALKARRADVLLRFVPARHAALMTEEKMRDLWKDQQARKKLDELIARLEANLQAAIRESGDAATLAYGDNRSVSFVREDGLWKIEDPE